ncbi:MAG: ATP-binding protein [bacterium]|nr:ATP-binding protein [bacterium]
MSQDTLDSQNWTALLEAAQALRQTEATDPDYSVRVAKLLPDLLGLLDHQQGEIDRKDRQLKASQAQLIQSGRMAAVGQLAAGVAHEVNNPLQIILSRVQLLMMRNQDLEPLFKDLQLIEANVKRISRIIRSLLDFARHNSGEEEWKSIDLAHLATQTSSLMQHLLEKAEIEFLLEIPDGGSPRMFGNVGEMEQVFLNLLINAQQHTSAGGRIQIDLEVQGGEAVIRVCDTGAGISKENLPHIFEPFFTTREDQGGTGLGLSIIHGIIEQHKGRIQVESQSGKGTTFTLYFPAAQSDP